MEGFLKVELGDSLLTLHVLLGIHHFLGIANLLHDYLGQARLRRLLRGSSDWLARRLRQVSKKPALFDWFVRLVRQTGS